MSEQGPPDLPVVVIGAGPQGLAAAAHLVERGQIPLVLEAGQGPAPAVAQWGHVRLFSGWPELVDPAAARLLAPSGWSAPTDGYPTGAGVDRVLSGAVGRRVGRWRALRSPGGGGVPPRPGSPGVRRAGGAAVHGAHRHRRGGVADRCSGGDRCVRDLDAAQPGRRRRLPGVGREGGGRQRNGDLSAADRRPGGRAGWPACGAGRQRPFGHDRRHRVRRCGQRAPADPAHLGLAARRCRERLRRRCGGSVAATRGARSAGPSGWSTTG